MGSSAEARLPFWRVWHTPNPIGLTGKRFMYKHVCELERRKEEKEFPL
jgi:hypothetical protein